MVKTRHSVKQIAYEPPPQKQTGMDIVYLPDLKQDKARVRRSNLSWDDLFTPHRLDHYAWVWVERGEMVQHLDFETYRLLEHHSLLIKPGQVHRFIDENGTQAWVVAFQEEFLLPADDTNAQVFTQKFRQLPAHQHFTPAQTALIGTCLRQMQNYRRLSQDGHQVDLLLRLQLYTLLELLSQFAPAEPPEKAAAQRFRRFNELLETHFQAQKSTAFYAAQLACTEKTLNRCCIRSAGCSAKTLIARRLVLEAKRRLAHTPDTVSQTAYRLGFDDPTNFTKFFKKQTGQTPKTFRETYLGEGG